MNVLIQLAHPAHYYYYKNTIANLCANGHKVIIALTTKDILETLVCDAGLDYVNVQPTLHRKSKIGYFWDMMLREVRIINLCLKHHIDLLTGSTIEVSSVGWLLRKHSINIGEDDAAVVGKYINAIAPFVDTRLTPDSCNNGKIENHSVHYPGFLKLAYLHPNVFTPSEEIVSKYGIDIAKTYFLIRFSGLRAHHDAGVQGISTEVAQHIIDLLSPHGRIYITSERELEPQFEQYRLHIDPLDIHHIMAYATIYIGDSQSMAVEAAMLGVPSLRFNDFVGKKKIGVMEELEHVYGLTFGISSHEPEQLYAKVEEFLALAAKGKLREEFQKRRQKMLADKIDVTAFFTWFIENYPASAQQTKQPDFNWKQFKI
ncbi:MAG: hypothetical protein KBT27_01815 [Prevotellaceae bacterium]|nr:hypothetical protein [Candidatus Faecinaster equi]